jgi:hypothetical protein
MMQATIEAGAMVVMLLDDLQWDDAETWQLTKELTAKELDMSQLLLIGTCLWKRRGATWIRAERKRALRRIKRFKIFS